MNHTNTALAALSLTLSLGACGGGDGGGDPAEGGYTNGANLRKDDGFLKASVGDRLGKASFRFDKVVLKVAGGQEVTVSLNGMDLYKVNGGIKKDGTQWDVVQRAGVRMDDIFAKAGVTADDGKPVNLVGGDGFDVLRGKYKNDLSKLPRMDFMRAHAYVYADDPGSKHPGYPAIGNDGLIVDYDLASDGEVPGYVGEGIAALSTLRMRVMESAKGADYGMGGLGAYRGLIEVDPQLSPGD